MAIICQKCQNENPDNTFFCGSCGSSLDKSLSEHKPVHIGENSSRTVRTMILIVLIAAILLSVFTVFQYTLGVLPIKRTIKYDTDQYDYNDLLEEKIEDTAYGTNSSKTMNMWLIYLDSREVIKDLDPLETEKIYFSLFALSQVCNFVSYLIVSILLLITLIMVIKRAPAAKSLLIISGCTGLLVIIFGYLIGYYLISYKDTAYLSYGYSYLFQSRILPQKTVCYLIPLLIQLPIFGALLPRRK